MDLTTNLKNCFKICNENRYSASYLNRLNKKDYIFVIYNYGTITIIPE